MTDPHDDDLRALDAHARTAARRLQEHVLERVDVEQSLHSLGTVRQVPRRRLLGVAAAVLLVTGSVALLGQGADDERSRVDVDELPEVEPGVLRPLGPRDGRDSIQLPVTAEPNRDLRDGDVVTVSSPGFEPGEQVGIVQCAREAGGDTPEVRGGVDGCYVGGVQYAEADADGVATGTYTVRRVLTTPITGTVDCAAEAERCIVAMGAINDYDRSGGMAISFLGGGEPIDIPIVTVDPADELTDGQMVRVTGEGFVPAELVDLMVCSTDPSGCWMTGEDVSLEAQDQRGEGDVPGLRADAGGRIDGTIPVWRYLPGPEAGSYIDCAVSACTLRVMSQHASPPTVALGFQPGGTGPVAPSIAVTPTEGLAPGEEVVVQGAGFTPGGEVFVSLCVGPPGEVENRYSCGSTDGGGHRVEDDGTFAVDFELPDLEWGEMTATTCQGASCGGPEDPGRTVKATCDGVESECSISVDVYQDGPGGGPPTWSPVPVVVTFR